MKKILTPRGKWVKYPLNFSMVNSFSILKAATSLEGFRFTQLPANFPTVFGGFFLPGVFVMNKNDKKDWQAIAAWAALIAATFFYFNTMEKQISVQGQQLIEIDQDSTELRVQIQKLDDKIDTLIAKRTY